MKWRPWPDTYILQFHQLLYSILLVVVDFFIDVLYSFNFLSNNYIRNVVFNKYESHIGLMWDFLLFFLSYKMAPFPLL